MREPGERSLKTLHAHRSAHAAANRARASIKARQRALHDGGGLYIRLRAGGGSWVVPLSDRDGALHSMGLGSVAADRRADGARAWRGSSGQASALGSIRLHERREERRQQRAERRAAEHDVPGRWPSRCWPRTRRARATPRRGDPGGRCSRTMPTPCSAEADRRHRARRHPGGAAADLGHQGRYQSPAAAPHRACLRRGDHHGAHPEAQPGALCRPQARARRLRRREPAAATTRRCRGGRCRR